MPSSAEFNQARAEESWRKSQELAEKWTEEEIAESGFDPDSAEANFHRFMARAFGTMTVAPLEKKPTVGEIKNG